MACEGLVWCACLLGLEIIFQILYNEKLVLQWQVVCLDPKSGNTSWIGYLLYFKELENNFK